MKTNSNQINIDFNIGDHVIGFTPKIHDKQAPAQINGFVTRITSHGLYVTDGAKSQVDQIKVEASEWHSIELCNIRRA